jgi:TctA family transporter
VSALRPWRLLVVGLVVSGAVWLVLSRAQAQGMASLPVPWLTPVVLVAMTGGVVAGGRWVKAWVCGRSSRPPTALTAARIAAVSAAAGWAGALLFGWYAGQAAVLAPALVGERSARFVVAVVAALASVALSASGVLAQRWCRRPEDDDPPGTGALPTT